MAEKVWIRLVHSPIGTTTRVRETLKGLGLRKLGSERELERSAAVDGMIRRVSHLVEVRSS